MTPKSCRLLGHATEQILSAKSRFNLKGFRFLEGVGEECAAFALRARDPGMKLADEKLVTQWNTGGVALSTGGIQD